MENLFYISLSIIAIFFIYSLLRLISRYRSASGDIKTLLTQTKSISFENVNTQHFIITEEIVQNQKATRIANIWREFDESLVYHDEKIENTLDADHFFNENTLASNLFYNDFLKNVPNTLVGLGVIFTFIGLVLGLSDLSITSDNIESLKTGIESIVNGAKISFWSSIVGIILSIVFSILLAQYKTKLRHDLQRLQRQIDYCYPRTNPEKSLAQIREFSKVTEMHLGALSETLGEKLQEAVRGVGEEISRGVQESLTSAIRPFMDDIASKAMNSSETAFDQIINEFLKKIGAAGEQQQKMILETNKTIQETLLKFREDFLQDVSGLKNVVENLNQSYHVLEEKVIDRFDNVVATFSAAVQNHSIATEKLLEQANSFDKLTQDFEEISSGLGLINRDLVIAIKVWKDQVETNEKMFQRSISSLSNVYESNNQVNRQLANSTDNLNTLFGQLRQEYNEMRRTLEQAATEMSNRMNGALNSYFSQVQQQTTERMREWNNQTSTFSSAMLDVANELNQVVESIKEKNS
ncbi:anti-phage ZorAB system protein ZorA [Robiginitalea sp.]|nr:anti-phage ZorAB system protein ZorA [Robiginitalea sp.]